MDVVLRCVSIVGVVWGWIGFVCLFLVVVEIGYDLDY